MNKSRLFAIIGCGAVAFFTGMIPGLLHVKSAWLFSGIVATVAFLAGFLNITAGTFFGGVAFALVCALMPGLVLGNEADLFMTVLTGPILVLWVLGIACLFFWPGRLVRRALAPKVHITLAPNGVARASQYPVMSPTASPDMSGPSGKIAESSPER